MTNSDTGDSVFNAGVAAPGTQVNEGEAPKKAVSPWLIVGGLVAAYTFRKQLADILGKVPIVGPSIAEFVDGIDTDKEDIGIGRRIGEDYDGK